MELIILAGGLGTRLKELFPNIPKILVKIDNKPFLDILLNKISKQKIVSKIILALGYKSDLIIDHVKNHFSHLPIQFSIECNPLGTGGAIKQAFKLIDSQNVFVLNGDSYLEISLSSMLDDHIKKDADITIAVTEIENSSRFGSILLSQDGKVLKFEEKQKLAQKSLINAGIYLMNRRIEKFFPKEEIFSLERDLFTKESLNIFSYLIDKKRSKFIDIGTRDSYNLANQFLKGCE